MRQDKRDTTEQDVIPSEPNFVIIAAMLIAAITRSLYYVPTTYTSKKYTTGVMNPVFLGLKVSIYGRRDAQCSLSFWYT